MTTVTSRRAILAGAAALPALSVPASASQISFPEIAARLDAIYARWLVEYGKDVEMLAAIDAALMEELGVSEYPHPEDPIYDVYTDARERLCKKLSDKEEDARIATVWNALHDEMYEVVDEILDQPTRSVADLGVQLRAFAWTQESVWTDGDDPNSDRVRQIINIACEFCGVDPLPGAEKYFAKDEEV